MVCFTDLSAIFGTLAQDMQGNLPMFEKPDVMRFPIAGNSLIDYMCGLQLF